MRRQCRSSCCCTAAAGLGELRATTRAAANARAGGYAVLLPEQASEANPNRCWNWFGREAIVATEAGILKAIVDHVGNVHAAAPGPSVRVRIVGGRRDGADARAALSRLLRRGRHAFGRRAAQRVVALQAGHAMRGRRSPELAPLRHRLAGRRVPPLFVTRRGDRSVAWANAEESVALWLGLLAPSPASAAAARSGAARRAPCVQRTDWKRDRRVYVRLVRVAGLGHAWSGGAAKQAFSDPRGPDALKLAWRFFEACVA